MNLQEIVIAPLPHKFGLPQSLATNMMGEEASGGSSEVIAKSWLMSTAAGQELMAQVEYYNIVSSTTSAEQMGELMMKKKDVEILPSPDTS